MKMADQDRSAEFQTTITWNQFKLQQWSGSTNANADSRPIDVCQRLYDELGKRGNRNPN